MNRDTDDLSGNFSKTANRAHRDHAVRFCAIDNSLVTKESNRMRTLAARYLRYSDSTSLVVSPLDHHGSIRKRSDTTGKGISVASGSWCASSASARGMW